MLRDAQVEMRKSGIGASEVAAVLGVHATRRPIDVYAEKIGEAELFEGNAFTEWGNRLERAVAEAWADRHPDKAIFTPPTLRHPAHSWALATPDRVVVPPGRRAREVWEKTLEIKNISTFRARDFDEDDSVPEHMLVQVQWQLEVVDLPCGTLVPLIGGHDYREIEIQRDRELGGLLLQAVEKFWVDHVLARVPPPIDGSDAYEVYLRRRHPKDTVPAIPATPEAEEVVRWLREAKEAKAQAEQMEADAKQQLLALIGDAAGVEGLCTFKSNKDATKIDWEGIAKVLNPDPAVIAQFTTTRPGARVLRLSKEK